MLKLVAGITLGTLISCPQLWAAWQYYPQCIRSVASYEDKVTLGNVGWKALIAHVMGTSRHDWVDGVAFSEVTCYPGLLNLVAAGCCSLGWWHGVLFLSALLAMGKHTPLFRWTQHVHLRIPARYCYLVNLSLVMLALGGFSRFLSFLPPYFHPFVIFLGAWELMTRLPRLSPTAPYCQRWMKPSNALAMPVAQFLQVHLGAYRASGLPYPHRTGLLAQIRTLGYNGGSQPKWMAELRGDTNPNGSGAHDWFAMEHSTSFLNWYGVKYASTMRSLLPPQWAPTRIPHLYENRSVCRQVPSWQEMADG